MEDLRKGLIRKWARLAMIAVLLALSLSPSLADVLAGSVVKVSDGDTITVLDSFKRQHKIRLAGIDDAPEKRQPFGEASRKHLASLISGKSVTVEWTKRDRYGRIVGKVLHGTADACRAQIEAGLAWHFKRYQQEQTPDDRSAYAQAEVEARAERAGLWQDKSPVAPWDWRRLKRADELFQTSRWQCGASMIATH